MTDTTLNPTHSPIKLSRRAFLVGIGVIAAGSAVVAVQQRQLLAPNATEEELLATLQRALFVRFINDTFSFMLDDVQATLSLTAVTDLLTPITFASEAQNRAYHKISFSIQLSGASREPLIQGNYTVEHHHIGTFPLFIVPLQPSGDSLSYVATFNRLPA